MEYYEGKIIKETLEAHGWNKEDAARALDVDLATLYRKIKKLGIAES
jgi:DNA-binding NtrC family response regulator